MSHFILDCDPGHDDAVAMLFAAKHLSLSGITTVFGNTNVDNTTKNALALIDAAGIEVPVAQGAAGPLSGTLESGESVHGKSGLDGANLPQGHQQSVTESGAEFLISAARKESDLVIIAIAPLTNLALALMQAPDIAQKIQEISIMGGSTGVGNVTPVAEFNIFADPEAAAIVFSSGIPIRMAGLNITSKFGINASQVAALRASSALLPREIGGALDYYLTRQHSIYGRTHAPIHDVCAVIPYTHPDLIQYESMHVEVECQGDITRGQTVCDQRGIMSDDGLSPPKFKNARVAISARGETISNLAIESLLSYT
ncbi:MAG TPA: pyrimidine-specific ribonucleoside hydrolase RihA [Gammaproteobacteria bacterium]|nr:pyrimidine-specific ribonucleoside hydrolase RihA [Gammaproteobacteria bacterium]